jgi:hypothetical protein
MALKINKIDCYVFMIIFFIFSDFLADGISKYLLVQGNGFYRISLLVNIVFEIIIIFYLLININKTIFKYFFLIIILYICFIIGQLLINNLNNFFESIIQFNKYIYVFLIYLFLYKILYIENKKRLYIYRSLMIVIFLISITIFIGLIFNIVFFKTFYYANYRFGYNGVFIAGNESSYVFIILISFLYFKAFYERESKFLLFMPFALPTKTLL